MSTQSSNEVPGSDEWYRAIKHELRVDEYKLWLSNPDYHPELAEKLTKMEEQLDCILSKLF